MKAKLIKVLEHYHLYDGDKAVATTIIGNPMLLPNLSLKNCQAIELGYDLDELTKDLCTNVVSSKKDCSIKEGYILGFQKALEILGDKKFNEKDIKKRIELVKEQFREDVDGYGRPKKIMSKLDTILQSLQQTEWDVKICCHTANGNDSFNCQITTNTGIPKLDKNNCIILRRI